MFSCALQREENCKQISLACMMSACSVWATLGLPPLTACALSQSTLLRLQVALQGNCLKRALGWRALPRSKPLRFRFSGTPQRDRLSWACVLCPSQVRTAQATRCSGSALSQLGGASNHLPGPSPSVSWVCHESAVSDVSFGSSGELISDCDPPGRC